jgi:hypothetical protein
MKRGPYRVERDTVEQPQDQSIRYIPLTQGQVATVDAVDFERINQWNWHAQWNPSTQSFYAWRNITIGFKKYTRISMHNEVTNTPKGYPVDHRNGDSLDNRRDNLKPCTQAENMRNKGQYSNNRSGHPGVSWHSRDQKWTAFINLDKKRYSLGYFDSLEKAIEARRDAEILLHGEFAQHQNRPTLS